MKNNYVSPEMTIDEIAVVNCLCLSIQNDFADDSTVLSKELPDDISVQDIDF